MIDFKCIGLNGVRIFSVSENGKNGLGDEGLMWQCPPPHNFWARTVPAGYANYQNLLRCTKLHSTAINAVAISCLKLYFIVLNVRSDVIIRADNEGR